MPSLIDMVRATVWAQGGQAVAAAPAKAPEAVVAAPVAQADGQEQTAAKAQASEAGTTAEVSAREALKAKGVKFHHKTSDANLATIHAAFTQSELTADEWNALSDEDKAVWIEAAK